MSKSACPLPDGRGSTSAGEPRGSELLRLAQNRLNACSTFAVCRKPWHSRSACEALFHSFSASGRNFLVLGILVIAALAVLEEPARPQTKSAEQALLDQYCVTCH